MSLINIREKSNGTKSIKERYNLFMIPNTCQGRYEGCAGQEGGGAEGGRSSRKRQRTAEFQANISAEHAVLGGLSAGCGWL